MKLAQIMQQRAEELCDVWVEVIEYDATFEGCEVNRPRILELIDLIAAFIAGVCVMLATITIEGLCVWMGC